MSNVTALPGFSVPSRDPIERVVEILEEALEAARAGKITGVALVTVERDPTTFVTLFHCEQSGRHSLGSGVLALSYQIGKVFSEDD
jgi:hypothetical protein